MIGAACSPPLPSFTGGHHGSHCERMRDQGRKLVDNDHPTREELEGLMLGSLSPQRDRAVILHLLHGCEACTQVLLPYVPPCFLPKGHEIPAPPFPPEDYDA